MERYQNKYRTTSIRLDGWDYSTPWWYFITIVVKKHIEFFGKIQYAKMYSNLFGKSVNSFWMKIPEHYKFVELDIFIVMPNHVHGIIIMNYQIKDFNKYDVETGHAPSILD